MEKTKDANTPDVTPNVTPNKGERRKQKPKFTPNKEELRNRKEVATKYSGLYTEVLKNGDISFQVDGVALEIRPKLLDQGERAGA